MGSTSAPLLGLVFGPVTAGWGPVVAYNLAISASLALSAWCAFLLCSRLVRSRVAGAIAGLIYGFSPFMVGHSLGGRSWFAPVFSLWWFLSFSNWLFRPRRLLLRPFSLFATSRPAPSRSMHAALRRT